MTSPFRDYDGWLVGPMERMTAEGDAWADACERYEESDAYWQDVCEWLAASPLSEYNTDDRLCDLLALYAASNEYHAKVEIREARVELVPEEWPDDDDDDEPDDDQPYEIRRDK